MSQNLAEKRHALQTLKLLSNGGKIKAKVYITRVDGKKYVVKDFSATPFYFRFLARAIVNHEIKVLTLLSFSRQVPQCYGKITPYIFAIEYIPGEHFPLKNREETDLLYQNALQFVKEMHAKGIIHNDLNYRNLIAHPERGLVVIDFASSIITGRWIKYLRAIVCINWLFEQLEKADIFHLVNYKSQLTTTPHTQDEMDILRKGRPFKLLTQIWKKIFRRKSQ
jgi:RIO-like serine/threonine protein kinase